MENYREVKKVLIQIFLLNLLVSALKLVFGFLAGSLSMVADSFHSFFDSTSNIIGLIAINISSKPADKDHPYGHRKIEYFATIAIAILIFIACIEIIESAASSLLANDYSSLSIVPLTAGVMILTILINYFVAKYEHKKGHELCSPFLEADSIHTKTDVYISLSVLSGFLFIEMGYPIFDPLIALLIGVFIVKMGVTILKKTSAVLCDTSMIDERKICAIAESIEGVLGCHNVRTRGSKEEIYLDLHVNVNPELTVRQGHEISDKVEKELKKHFNGLKDIVVHIEPA